MGSNVSEGEQGLGPADLVVPEPAAPAATPATPAVEGLSDKPAGEGGWDKDRQAADEGKARVQREALGTQVEALSGMMASLTEQVKALAAGKAAAAANAGDGEAAAAAEAAAKELPEIPDLDPYAEPAEVVEAFGALKAHLQAVRDGGGSNAEVAKLQEQVKTLGEKLDAATTVAAEDAALKGAVQGFNKVYGAQHAADALAATQEYFKSRKITNPGDELQATRLELEYARLSGRTPQQPAPAGAGGEVLVDSGTGGGMVPSLGQCDDYDQAAERLKARGFRLTGDDLTG